MKPVQRDEPLFWNRAEMEQRPDLSVERDRTRYEGSRRTSARAPPAPSKSDYEERMFAGLQASEFAPTRYESKSLLDFRSSVPGPGTDRFPGNGPVPPPVSGLNSSWLENWAEPSKSKKEIWQEKERAREKEKVGGA